MSEHMCCTNCTSGNSVPTDGMWDNLTNGGRKKVVPRPPPATRAENLAFYDTYHHEYTELVSDVDMFHRSVPFQTAYKATRLEKNSFTNLGAALAAIWNDLVLMSDSVVDWRANPDTAVVTASMPLNQNCSMCPRCCKPIPPNGVMDVLKGHAWPATTPADETFIYTYFEEYDFALKKSINYQKKKDLTRHVVPA